MKNVSISSVRVLATIVLVACSTAVLAGPVTVPPNPGTIKFAPASINTQVAGPVTVPPNPGTIKFAPASINTQVAGPVTVPPNPGTIKFASSDTSFQS